MALVTRAIRIPPLSSPRTNTRFGARRGCAQRAQAREEAFDRCRRYSSRMVRRALLAFLITATIAAAASAVGDAALTPSERTLLNSYLSATRSNDAAAIKSLLHRQVSACLSPENADFYDQMFATLARRRIPDSYELN